MGFFRNSGGNGGNGGDQNPPKQSKEVDKQQAKEHYQKEADKLAQEQEDE